MSSTMGCLQTLVLSADKTYCTPFGQGSFVTVILVRTYAVIGYSNSI